MASGDIKSKIGYEDLNVGFGTFQRRLSDGSLSTMNKIDVAIGAVYNVKNMGAKGDGSTDDTAIINQAITLAESSFIPIFFPAGDYIITSQLTTTKRLLFIGVRDQTNIKLLNGTADAVIKYDGSGSYIYGGGVKDIVLWGNANVTDGLLLTGVINGHYENVRVKDVAQAGFHGNFCQLCTFINPTVSANYGGLNVTPENGFLFDTALCSANILWNPTIESVSGAGIKGVSLLNSLIVNGTSEGNDIGIELGETPAVSLSAGGNKIIGMDMEVNASGDYILHDSAFANDFFSVNAGYLSGTSTIEGYDNRWWGGSAGDMVFDAGTTRNVMNGTRLLGTGDTITDNGTNNRFVDIFNLTDATVIVHPVADVEDGEFTPEYADAPSGGNTASTATNSGQYTRIGRTVHVWGQVTGLDTTGMTGGNPFYIRNLPFYCNVPSVGSLRSSYVNWGYWQPQIIISSGTAAGLNQTADNDTVRNVTVAEMVSGSAGFWFYLVYKTPAIP